MHDGLAELYDDRLAEVYDVIYKGSGKDYDAEAQTIARLIRERRPDAVSLLDAACGTGEHLRYLRRMFDHVEGFEAAEAMRTIAAAKLPDVSIHLADMRTFELHRTFDAVVSLFCAVAYLRDTDELATATSRMARHLSAGGVLILEPWVKPEYYRDGAFGHIVVEHDGRTVVRMTHSGRRGRTSVVDMRYLVGEASGIRSWREVHEMQLFTFDDFRRALAGAGFTAVEFLPGWRPGSYRVLAVK